ncbi:hypothetical protein [Leucobacter sp. NPDC077196]|uniref:hypothetical protein n=1 Tax=Leucobacter sp. NPDC077196 TaxID=3154959 RepID=UPI003429B6D5
MTKRRPVALGAAITIGFGSLFFASPAFAEEVEAPTDQQQKTQVPDTAPDDAALALEKAGVEVVALGVGADGLPVIIQTEGSESGPDVDAAVSAYAADLGAPNATVQTVASAPVAYAANDVVGGAGYLAFEGETPISFCSVGFTAWSPEGDPVLLSAGHCTRDGELSDTGLVLPSVQPAVTGGASNTGGTSNGTGILGAFGFSQFGGVGNTEADPETPDPEGTDISIIEDIGEDFNLLPEITDWTTAEDDDLAASTIKVKSANLGNPVAGSTVSKSGRTTGYTSGSVGALVDGWARISTPEGEPRWVRGFESDVLAAPGDSGGAVFQGESAIGVISGGSPATETLPQFTWTASLKHTLPHIPGYEIALDIDEPVVKTDVSEGVPSGSDIVVTVPSNAKELSFGQGEPSDSIPVEGTEVSFTAPDAPGNYSYTLFAQNGFSQSEPVEVNFEVVLAAPTVADVDTTENDVTLTGTGIPTAEVTVELDGASYTATVGEDRNWSVEVADLAIGEYTVTASQTFEGDTSADATGNVIVRPTAVGDLSIAGGSSFAAADAPTEISGTGVEGAAINLSLNGTLITDPAAAPAALAEVVDGAWTVDFGGQLPTGTHTVDVSQTVNGVTSVVTTIVFAVEAAPVAPVAPVDPGAPADPANPAAPGGQGGTGGAELVNTGTGFSMLPFGLAALGMLVLGGGAIVFTQRRLQATAAE